MYTTPPETITITEVSEIIICIEPLNKHYHIYIFGATFLSEFWSSSYVYRSLSLMIILDD